MKQQEKIIEYFRKNETGEKVFSVCVHFVGEQSYFTKISVPPGTYEEVVNQFLSDALVAGENHVLGV